MKEHVAKEHTRKEIAGDTKEAENKHQTIECAVCLKEFVSKVKLEEHIEAEHREETDERRQHQTTLAKQDDEGIDDAQKVLI